MRRLSLLVGLTVLNISICLGQFTSSQSGYWDIGTTWGGACASGCTAGVDYPGSTDDAIISVTHTVTVPAGVTISRAGSSTTTINGTLEIEDDGLGGNGILDISGTLINNQGGAFLGDTEATVNFNSGGLYRHNYTTSAGSIVIATWNSGSTCEISGYTTNTTAPGNLGQSFSNVTWNCSSFVGGGTTAFISLAGQLTSVSGNLTVSHTGGASRTLRLFDTSSSSTLTIGGNIVVNGSSRLVFSTTGTGNSVTAANFTITNSATATSTMATSGSTTLTLSGGLTINSTAATTFVMSSLSGGSATITTGDFTMSPSVASTFNLGSVSGASGTINISGNFSINSSSTVTRSSTAGAGTATVNFTGSSVRTFTNSGTISNAVNFSIANGKTLNTGTSAITGSGTFTLNAGGTLGVGSADGLNISSTALGNIRVTGVRTYIANGNIVYNGSVAQTLGDEWASTGALNGVAVNLEIANTNSGGVTNNVTGSTSLVGNLTLTSNPLHIGNSNTLIIQSNFTATSGTIGGLSTSNLTFSGSGTISGTLNFASGSQNLNNFTISRSGTILLGTPLTISGTLAFSSTGNLQFNGLTLTVNGDITQSGSGGLISNSSSNLIIGGTGALSALPFVSSSQLNNVTLDRGTGGAYTWNSAVIVNGTLSLSQGTLTHSSGLTMASGSTFSRSSGASITSNAPNTSASYNVSYTGTLTTGLELPSSATALSNLTVAGDATLDKSVTINGDLNINSGTFNASTFNLTMAGDDFLINGGTFTINSASTVTFSRSGTTTMSGSSIGGTQFGNLTINTGATLGAPGANINISGTWDNQGIFTPNGGTVTFNGASQNIDPNGQPFNNVSFAGTGTKTLQGALDVDGTLTITSTLDVGANNSVNVAGSWTNNGTFTAAGGTVTFDGTSQSINPNGQSFFNLMLTGSGTKTLAAAIDINGAVTINSGVTFDVSATAYSINIAGNWTNNGTFTRRTGTVTFDGATAIAGSASTSFHNLTIAGALTASSGTTSVSGNWLYGSGSFAHNSGTIQFDGGGSQSITSGGQAFNNLVVNGSNAKTLQDNVDINGNLTLSAGAFSVGTDRTVNLAGNFDASGGGTLTSASGLFIFDGAAQNITSGGESFFNAEFSGSGTKTLVDAFDANGYMDINVTMAAGSNSINVGGNWDTTGGSFTTTGTTTFDGAAQNLTSNGSSFGAVTIAGSGTKTLQDALDVNGNLTISSTLSIGVSNFAITAGGNWNSSAGTFAPTGGLVTLDGAAQTITLGASNNFRSLTIAGSGTKTLQDVLDVNSNLVISSGAVLNVGTNNNIEIAGSWTNNVTTGGFIAGSGTVIFDGGGTSDVNGTGATAFSSINVTGSTNVEIETTHSFTGTLTLVGASSSFDADGSGGAGVFTLISSDDDPTVDGRIAALTTPANFTGNVTVQRFMSQESMPSQSNNRLYRYISSPVSGAAVSQIQSEIPVTGSFTGSSTCSGCGSTQSMFGYDESIGTTFDEGWVDFPAAANTETLQQGVGYALYVRGNVISSALWDVRGPVFTGNINLPVTYNNVGGAGAAGFNLVGNPYPSAIDWDLVYPGTTNLANAIYIRDNANGVYAQYVGGVGSNGGSKDIAMGQAFWVEATAASPSLPLTESVKSSSSTTFFRTGTIPDLLRIALTNSNLRDETVIRFHDSGTELFDASYDARKLANTIFNLSSVLTDDQRLSVNTLGSIGCGREVKLDITNVTTGYYELSLSEFESFSDLVAIKLVDTYLDQTLDVRGNSNYGFDIDSTKPETFGADRFKIVFEYEETLGLTNFSTADVCSGADAAITIMESDVNASYALYSDGQLIADGVSGNGGDLTIDIENKYLKEGENLVEIKSTSLICDQLTINTEVVIQSEAIPTISSVENGTHCLSGTVTLSASGGEEGNFRWYESADASIAIVDATSGTFVTPELSKSKTYYVSAVNALGCESPRVEAFAEVINFDQISISEPEPGVFLSSYSEGNQWYKDGELIPGATSQSFSPQESGVYSVEVSIGQCKTTSEREYVVTAIEDSLPGDEWMVYPNPVTSELIVESQKTRPSTIKILDMIGRPVGQINLIPSGNKSVGRFDFSEHPGGVYILKVTDNDQVKYKRIVKE